MDWRSVSLSRIASFDRARWDADAAQDQFRDYVLEELSSADAVLIADETGFLKKASIQLE